MIASDSECQHVLSAIIDGYVLPGLKEPQLTYSLGRNSAGGKVGYASGLELDRASHINFVGQNGHTNRPHFFHRRINKRQHCVQIMNHEVKHDVNIQKTGASTRQPVHFKEHRLGDQGNCGLNRRIEALKMLDLNNGLCTLCDGD